MLTSVSIDTLSFFLRPKTITPAQPNNKANLLL